MPASHAGGYCYCVSFRLSKLGLEGNKFDQFKYKDNRCTLSDCKIKSQTPLYINLRANLARDQFFPVLLSPDFPELWCSVMSTCLITEVKQQ